MVIFIPNAITKGPGCCSYLKMQQETQCMLLSTTSPNIDRFSKCFTSRLISSLNAIKRSVKTPPNHKRIATLSFAILMSIFGENYGQQRMMSPFRLAPRQTSAGSSAFETENVPECLVVCRPIQSTDCYVTVTSCSFLNE